MENVLLSLFNGMPRDHTYRFQKKKKSALVLGFSYDLNNKYMGSRHVSWREIYIRPLLYSHSAAICTGSLSLDLALYVSSISICSRFTYLEASRVKVCIDVGFLKQ